MTPYYTLGNIPMPPSSNEQYWARAVCRAGKWMGVIAPSTSLTKYQDKTFDAWAKQSNVALLKARQFIQTEMLKGKMIAVHRIVCFPHHDLWTKDSRPRRLDGTNRIKALDDCLADVLQVDDSCFWAGSIMKCETSKPDPYVIAVIKGHTPIGVRDITPEFLAAL